MLKQKKYDLSNSNIALLGSDLEKKVRQQSGKGEDQWKNAGKAPGLQIWRAVDFKIVPWAEKQYGEFYEGDSYIVLHTYKKNPSANTLSWDIFFWLGKRTSQDEAGTVAYKTVELDDFLGGSPIQHREVQEHESQEFLKLFQGKTRYLKGGADSGFHHVTAEEYKPRLLHIRGKGVQVRAKEVATSAQSLNSGDVFILDLGNKVYQWCGKSAGIFEVNTASQMCRALDDQRKGQVQIHVIKEGESSSEESAQFWKNLGGEIKVKSAEQANKEEEKNQTGEKKLFRVHDGNFSPVTPVSKSSLKSDDVFVLDAVCEIFVWVGKGSSKEERSVSLRFAQEYLQKNGKPLYLPITKILEGGENEVFLNFLQ